MEGPEETNGIIAILAPIRLDIAGKKVHSAHVDFDHDAPVPGTAMPTLQMFSPAFFHVAGGDGGADVGLNFGVANPTGDPSISNPDIMPTGSVNARFTGGNGDDTISEVFWFDSRSMGQVTASATGGAGSDDLTLEIYGYVDLDLLNALIECTGQDTVHNTPNVRVINRDGGR
jgi:hypothetical protein